MVLIHLATITPVHEMFQFESSFIHASPHERFLVLVVHLIVLRRQLSLYRSAPAPASRVLATFTNNVTVAVDILIYPLTLVIANAREYERDWKAQDAYRRTERDVNALVSNHLYVFTIDGLWYLIQLEVGRSE